MVGKAGLENAVSYSVEISSPLHYTRDRGGTRQPPSFTSSLQAEMSAGARSAAG